MDLIVRDLSPVVVQRLNNLAKKKGQSREEYLREQLEIISVTNLLEEHQHKTELLVNSVNEQLVNAIQQLVKIEKSHDKVFNMFAMYLDIPLEKLKEIV